MIYKNHKIGKIGEKIAINYLIQNGYEIIETNFMCKQGEIDIIALDKKEIVFIEVKTRTNHAYGEPIEAVNKIKQKHIYEATKYYVYKNKLENKYIRFDVIEVEKIGKKLKINQVKKAIGI